MARTLPWKRASAAHPESFSSPRRASPKIETPRRTTAAVTPTGDATRHRPSVLAAFNSSDPLRSPSTSPPPEPPQERYMAPGDDQYRIVEDELLRTAQRFTTHLHRAEYHRLKIAAKSNNDAAIREVERPVVVGSRLTTAARRRRDQAQRLSKQRSVLSSGAQDENITPSSSSSSPWVGTNLRGLLNAPRAETGSLVPQAAASASSSLTKAAVGHRPPPASTPQRRRPLSHGTAATTTPVSAATTGLRARNLATPASSTSVAPSSSAPRRPAKREADAPTPTPPEDDGDEDDLDFDDPFGLNKRRLDRKKSRDQFRRSIRATPTKMPSSSSTMPSFA